MGLHSPFGYVDYEVAMAELFIDILDKLCAHCHTNDDYSKGCHECSAGNLAFECRDYILTAEEEDKHHELYVSEEWLERRRELGYLEQTEEERKRELKFAEEYKPECEVLRALKVKIEHITPHPFFYVRHHQKYPYERPKALADFIEMTEKYKKLRADRLHKWGLGRLV